MGQRPGAGAGHEQHGECAEDVEGGFEGHEAPDVGAGVAGVEGDGGGHGVMGGL